MQEALEKRPLLAQFITVIRPYKQAIIDSIEHSDTVDAYGHSSSFGKYGRQEDGSYALYSPSLNELQQWVFPRMNPQEWQAVEAVYQSEFRGVNMDGKSDQFSFGLERMTCGDTSYYHTLYYHLQGSGNKAYSSLPVVSKQLDSNWTYRIESDVLLRN